MLGEILGARSLEQPGNVGTLPGIVDAAFALPDIYEGYGFPFGWIAAKQRPDGAISPGEIGYDINCDTRLLRSDLTQSQLVPFKETLVVDVSNAIPSGTGQHSKMSFDFAELDEVLRRGAD